MQARNTRYFTVGYAGRSVKEFVRTLLAAGVDRVVDVRELPLSRRRGFSKTPLTRALAASGIEYVHLRAAGNPYRAQKADLDRCLARYARYLDRSPQVVAELERVLADRRAALLCVEADAARCHRTVIVQRLRERHPRWRVEHL